METDNTDAKTPRGNAHGFIEYLRHDCLSGFLVFLIALPLCLGISIASGYPAIAGVFTAFVGAVLATFISNSELTIKGPAAGLIVIAIGCIESFGGDGIAGGWSESDADAYRAALAVGVAAAIFQIGFGIARAGILGEFFPVSAVHGMLAAIGIIIIAKQIPVALGVSASGEPLELLREIPHFVAEANPAIALIGVTSILIMFTWPAVGRRLALAKLLPAPLVVLLIAVPMGMGFDLLHEHSYTLRNHEYPLGEQYLVAMPDRVFGMFDEITTPDFSALAQPHAWKWVLMFFIIGSLESVLSAKAVDLIDPWKRRASMDRDVVAIGVGNLCASMIGGLPMISEIVRSRANIDNGARTRFANLWHGLFMLACVALIPMALHRIPMAALGAMLIYTGFRLAHPSEFVSVLRIGREQLIIFCSTLVAVLATDLLIGIAVGVVVKMLIHWINGVPFGSLFGLQIDVVQEEADLVRLRAHKAAVFSNWIPLRRRLEKLGLAAHRNIELDLADTRLVDHSVMNKLQELQGEFAQQGLTLHVVGLESHPPLAAHAAAARRKGMWAVQRLTLVIDAACEQELAAKLLGLGVGNYTATACSGFKRPRNASETEAEVSQVRMEIIAAAETCQCLIEYLRREVEPKHHVTFCVESVKVARLSDFRACLLSSEQCEPRSLAAGMAHGSYPKPNQPGSNEPASPGLDTAQGGAVAGTIGA